MCTFTKKNLNLSVDYQQIYQHLSAIHFATACSFNKEKAGVNCFMHRSVILVIELYFFYTS